ncbi:Uncharacterised protein [Mycobacteroides abscessus subsp. bolletii]|uniref:hypothetical protein n=1 Tax=Mycobacteroides abscessus TaxID=36809 RepID=UPI0009A609BA|nr:hypothetical protein [Mycobacteroides abscessus]SKR94485.1 Uncharacterised protein [Mycobacteroides abscessus subsp. bolletii]SKS03098.1 Uncharacterised protein [Mycobacteroides abscessus subsp. bolletii]DAZ90110.1 TPA_asm: hypothetical protein PROPHIFVLQ01-1_23 [Mycobacterium phage prophiFVLQ01-1]
MSEIEKVASTIRLETPEVTTKAMTTGPFAGREVFDAGQTQGVEWAVIVGPVYRVFNGYVLVPEGHPWHGVPYFDIDVVVHGSLTYGEMWPGNSYVIGFDTTHFLDVWPGVWPPAGFPPIDLPIVWTPARVRNEVQELAKQVADARAVEG